MTTCSIFSGLIVCNEFRTDSTLEVSKRGFQLCDLPHQRITLQRTACAVPRNSRDRIEVHLADQTGGRLALARADRFLHLTELRVHRVSVVHQLREITLLLLLDRLTLTEDGLVSEMECLHRSTHSGEQPSVILRPTFKSAVTAVIVESTA